MNEVIARINVTTPSGRRIVRDLEKHKKSVKMEYPMPESIVEKKTYSIDEIFEMGEKILNDHYGTNYKI